MSTVASPAHASTTAAPIAGATALVVGCGITGLAAALELSQRGIRVTLLERDAEPATDTASDAFDHWKRKGAVQVRHSHVFLGRLRNLLRDDHPELLRALVDAGARELRMLDTPPQIDRGHEVFVCEVAEDLCEIIACFGRVPDGHAPGRVGRFAASIASSWA